MWIFTFIVALATLIAGLMGAFVPAGMQAPATPTAPVAQNPTPTPAPTPTPTPAPQPAAATSITTTELAGFLETAYVNGNKDAKVSVIEFSDAECPFCQRHHANGTLNQVKEKYGEDVNVVYAHFPLSFHPTAQKAGEAFECAWDIKDEEAFFAYKDAIFNKGGKPTLDVLEATAVEQGFDAEAFMECVNSGKFAQKVNDQMAFGRKLWVTWTPGNIVINTETGEFTKVSGAVPAAAFDPAVTQYLN